MKQIAPDVLLLERPDWGADPVFPRLGGMDDPRSQGRWRNVFRDERLYNIKHHTVGVDTDETRNIW